MQMPDPPRTWIEAAIRDRETNSAHAQALAQEAETFVNQTLEARGREPPLTNIARAMDALEPGANVNANEAHVEGGHVWHASLDEQVPDILGRVFLVCDELDWDLTAGMRDFRAKHKL